MVNYFIVFGMLLIASHGKAVEILTSGLPFVANYGSSINAHTINHDIRPAVVPVQTAALVQPVTPNFNHYTQFVQPSFARLASFPVQAAQRTLVPTVVQAQSINPINPITSINPINSINDINSNNPVSANNPNELSNQDGNPIFSQNDERNESIEVEAAQRTTEVQTRSSPARLEQPKEPKTNDIPNPVLLGTQFLARNNLKPSPTSTPNGFVFHSRMITDGGRIVNNVQAQFRQSPNAKSNELQSRSGKIQKLPNQEQPEGRLRQQTNDAGEQNQGNPAKSDIKETSKSQNVSPSVYTRFITF